MILDIAKRLFTPAAVAFLAYFAWDSRGLLLDVAASAQPFRLLAAVLAWSVMHLISPLFPTLVFRARHYALSYGTATDIHIRNLPARYVPGGIWHTVGRIAGFRRLGIRQGDIAIFVFLENALAISVAFAIGGSIVAWFQNMDGWGKIAAIAAAGGMALLLATPFILSLRIMKGDSSFPLRDVLGGIVIAAASLCVGASAFVIYVTAFPVFGLRPSPLETGGAYLFSWGVGFISVFAPQGIGVFEVLAGDLLRGSTSLKSTAALLAGFRIVILMSDFLTWGARQLLTGGNPRLRELD